MNIQQMITKNHVYSVCDECEATPCTCSSSVCGLAFSKAFVEDDE